MGMDFWGPVWKRVWEMAVFGLKLGPDLEMWAAHPYQKFQGVPPRAITQATQKNSGFFKEQVIPSSYQSLVIQPQSKKSAVSIWPILYI